MKLKSIRRSIGAILIEFAFALPVFLVLLYYIHDLPKMRLTQRRVQFMANELAAIIQNISHQKSTTDNPLITEEDLANALSLAGLSWFTGNTYFPSSDVTPYFGYILHSIYHRIVGINKNRAVQNWSKTCGTRGPQKHVYNEAHDTTIIPWSKSEMAASTIHPKLLIDQGEEKIILELEFFYDHKGQWDWKFPNGTSTGKITPRKAFDFLFLNPQGRGQNTSAFFPAVTIFTPIKNSFSTTPPSSQ